METSSLVFDIETLSPQKGVDIGKDVIIAIGMTDGEDYWLCPIKPEKRGYGDVLLEEGDVILNFCQELEKRKVKTLIGYNIFGFDLPHILLRTRRIHWKYNDRTGKNLGCEVFGALSGLQFIDLLFEHCKRTGEWPKLGELHQTFTEERVEPIDRNEIFVESAAQVFLGKPEKVLIHLQTDLEWTWKIYQWMKEKYKL